MNHKTKAVEQPAEVGRANENTLRALVGVALGESGVRGRAVAEMEKIGGPALVPCLGELVAADDRIASGCAIEALARIRTPEALAHLEHAAFSGKHAYSAAYVAGALKGVKAAGGIRLLEKIMSTYAGQSKDFAESNALKSLSAALPAAEAKDALKRVAMTHSEQRVAVEAIEAICASAPDNPLSWWRMHDASDPAYAELIESSKAEYKALLAESGIPAAMKEISSARPDIFVSDSTALRLLVTTCGENPEVFPLLERAFETASPESMDSHDFSTLARIAKSELLAIWWLGEVSDPRAVRLMGKLLDSFWREECDHGGDAPFCQTALSVLERLPEQPTWAIGSLKSMALHKRDAYRDEYQKQYRKRCVKLLSGMGDQAVESALEEIALEVGNRDAAEARLARCEDADEKAGFLEKVVAKAWGMDSYDRYRGDEHARLADWAALEMAETGNPRFEPLFEKMLALDEDVFFHPAIKGLAKIGTPKALEMLEKMAVESHPNYSYTDRRIDTCGMVSKMAAEELSETGNPVVIPILEKAVFNRDGRDDSSGFIAEYITQAVAGMRCPEAIPLLGRISLHPNPQPALAAVKGLAEKGSAATPFLARAALHKDPEVAFTAVMALAARPKTKRYLEEAAREAENESIRGLAGALLKDAGGTARAGGPGKFPAALDSGDGG